MPLVLERCTIFGVSFNNAANFDRVISGAEHSFTPDTADEAGVPELLNDNLTSFVNMGRLSPEKNQAALIQAFAKLLERCTIFGVSFNQDTATPEYHFEGYCTDVTPSNSENGYCELAIKFRLKPFKIWNYSINNNWKWDDFNFLADDIPIMEFEMVAGESIVINNPYAVPIYFIPYFNASDVQITIGNYVYALNSGKKSPLNDAPFLAYHSTLVCNSLHLAICSSISSLYIYPPCSEYKNTT